MKECPLCLTGELTEYLEDGLKRSECDSCETHLVDPEQSRYNKKVILERRNAASQKD